MQEDIGLLIKRISDKIQANVDASMKPFDITFSQGAILRYIRTHENVTQKDIEKFLNISHPATVGLVSRLEEKGFVTCFQDPKDKRNKIVQATTKALEMDIVMQQNHNETEKKIVQNLTNKQQEELICFLKQIISNLEK